MHVSELTLENDIGVGSIRNKIKGTDVSRVTCIASQIFSNSSDCFDILAPRYIFAVYLSSL